MSEKPKTARSYRTGIIDDNFSLHINIKWLGQLFVATTSIEELVNKHMIEEQKIRTEMEERISFFEKELNLNPFSWKRKKK